MKPTKITTEEVKESRCQIGFEKITEISSYVETNIVNVQRKFEVTLCF